MTRPISFMSANYVARMSNTAMTAGPQPGEQATNDLFCPIETFGLYFEQILMDIRAMGFMQLDIWQAHLNWRWATADHIAVAQELLTRHRLQVTSLAGDFGETRAEFEQSCRLAHALGIRILGGSASLAERDRPFVAAMLAQHELVLGLKNQTEKTSADMQAKINGSEGRIGTTVDTGWYGTHGYNAAQAIRELGPAVVHVHLKDVLAVGIHQTCRFGRGIVPLKDCVQALSQIGYQGSYTIEQEPDTADPTGAWSASRVRLTEWLSKYNVPGKLAAHFPALTQSV